MTDIYKAAEQALEALELAVMNGEHGLYRDELRQMQEAITTVQAALAQKQALEWAEWHHKAYPEVYGLAQKKEVWVDDGGWEFPIDKPARHDNGGNHE